MEALDSKNSIFLIILLIMGVGIASLILIFVGVLGGQTFSLTQSSISSLSATYTDELSGNITAVPYLLNLTHGDIYTGRITLTLWNQSSKASYGTLAKGTNYTVVDYDTGMVNITDIAAHAATFTVINSTYTTGDPVIQGNLTEAIRSSVSSIGTTGSYLPIIVLAVTIFILLGMIFVFMNKTQIGSGYGFSI